MIIAGAEHEYHRPMQKVRWGVLAVAKSRPTEIPFTGILY